MDGEIKITVVVGVAMGVGLGIGVDVEIPIGSDWVIGETTRGPLCPSFSAILGVLQAKIAAAAITKKVIKGRRKSK